VKGVGGRPPAAPRRVRPQNSAAVSTLMTPDPDGLRALLAEQPQTLEAGLQVFCDEDGAAVGAGYTTPVGQIDLLGLDRHDHLVVVSVMDKREGDEIVAEVLKRLGWVRKHIADAEGQRVRAIVLCDEMPESLGYTAAAVADTVCFKTYRMALTFDDVEF